MSFFNIDVIATGVLWLIVGHLTRAPAAVSQQRALAPTSLKEAIIHVPRNLNMYGVFEPSDLLEMWRELKRGDVSGESETSRGLRAAAIIQRRMIPHIGCRVRMPKPIAFPPPCRSVRRTSRGTFNRDRLFLAEMEAVMPNPRKSKPAAAKGEKPIPNRPGAGLTDWPPRDTQEAPVSNPEGNELPDTNERGEIKKVRPNLKR
jgi:hypothetical protein